MPAGQGLVFREPQDAVGVRVHVRLCFLVIQLAADRAEQLAKRLHVLFVGVFRVRQEFLNTSVHDAFAQHLLFEKLADEPDVAQHSAARHTHALLALVHLASLREVQLLRGLRLRGGFAFLRVVRRLFLFGFLFRFGLGLARRYARRRRRLGLRRVRQLLLRGFDRAVAFLELFLALGKQHAFERDNGRVFRVGTRRVFELHALREEPVAQRRAHRGVQLRERGFGERFVEQLPDQAHQGLRFVYAFLQNFLKQLLETLRCQFVQNTLEPLLLFGLGVPRGFVDGEEVVRRLDELRQPRIRAVGNRRAVVPEPTGAASASASSAAAPTAPTALTLLVGRHAGVRPLLGAAAAAAAAAARRAVPGAAAAAASSSAAAAAARHPGRAHEVH